MQGSPPQVRGKRNAFRLRDFVIRITPAGAGKTFPVALATVTNINHPRRCGENVYDSNLNARFTGSPPQVRGKPRRKRNRCPRAGITPAGAGKTWSYCPIIKELEDHPRRCGENLFPRKRHRQTPGSPPQVRGKLVFFVKPC